MNRLHRVLRQRMGHWTALTALFLTACSANPAEQQQSVPSAQPLVPARYVVEVAYEGLDLPSSLVFAPDGTLLILERGFAFEKLAYPAGISVLDLRTGALRRLDGDIPAVSHYDDLSGNQGGALGLALAPDYSTTGRVYVCYHHRAANRRLENRLSSFEIRDGRLQNESIILGPLPADMIHNGCRVVVDNSGLLYLSTGAMDPFDDALDLSRPSGKILRVTASGAIPADNPFPNSPVWSYGHRNPQGLAYDSETGEMWSTEHGENSNDELNRIERGANYGFPLCRGSAAIGETFLAEEFWADRLEIKDGRATCRMPEPHASRYRPAAKSYFPDSTVGISDLVVYRGAAFPQWQGNLLLAMMRAERLVRIETRDGRLEKEEILIDEEYGRLRDVTVGPDGFVYVITNETANIENWKGRSRLLRLRPDTRMADVAPAR